jgi:hypothetical protein
MTIDEIMDALISERLTIDEISEEDLDNEELAYFLSRFKAGKYFDRVSERLRDDEEFMEELLFEEDPSLFKYASLRIRSIRSFAMEAVQMEGSNMEFLPDAFKDDEEIALAALDYIDGIAWYHLSNRLKQDQDFIEKALIKCYHVLKFLPEEYRTDANIIRPYIQENGLLYYHLSDELKNEI